MDWHRYDVPDPPYCRAGIWYVKVIDHFVLVKRLPGDPFFELTLEEWQLGGWRNHYFYLDHETNDWREKTKS